MRKILEKVGYRRDRRGFTTPKAHVPITFRSFCLVLSCIYPLLVNPLDLIPPRCHIPTGSRGARGVTMLEYEDFCIEEWRKAHTWFEKVMFSTSKDLKNTKYNKLWPWRRLILLAEILASNKSPLCRIASLAFIFFKFLLQVTSGISISRLEIRQERTSRFYLRVKWTSAFKGFNKLLFCLFSRHKSLNQHTMKFWIAFNAKVFKLYKLHIKIGD